MTTVAATPLEERLVHLLQHLGISKAHIAARGAADWQGLATSHPDRIASLTLVCPASMDPRALPTLASRLLVLTGDRGPAAGRVRELLADLAGATSTTLNGYESMMWSDMVAERTAEIGATMVEFLPRIDQRSPAPPVRLPEGEGEAAGVSYRIRGTGPPLVLLPLDLAPSQWEPLIPALSARYCTITLGGAALGVVAILEARGRSVYLGMIRSVLDAVQVRPGETILDVGCGSGVVIREVARRTGGANRLLGVDISPYLLREAAGLARQEGLGDKIAFQEGRAEALPFPPDSIDVTLACTVFEEGDADRMLAELVRVTKPGGRVAVIVRAVDMPAWVNLPLNASVKSKVEAPGLIGAGAVAGGCADASLYQRFHAAGLTEPTFFPQLTAVTAADPRLAMFQQQILGKLNPDEASEWRRAVTQAETEGSFFIAQPHHCAVAIKR
jgi:SAM-dependent methyltransferase